jgi:glycosyltransferase involved in cell wall biosynthesis
MSGESAYPPRLRKLAAQLGLTEAVRFVGSQNPTRVATWLQAADVFVLATFREGCCNAVLEALACGLPVVTTAVGDNELYVAPPQHGLIVPAGDVHALELAIDTALTRTWNSRAIAQSIAQRGGWDMVATNIAEFFEARLRCGQDCRQDGETPRQRVRCQ